MAVTVALLLVEFGPAHGHICRALARSRVGQARKDLIGMAEAGHGERPVRSGARLGQRGFLRERLRALTMTCSRLDAFGPWRART